MYLKMGTQNRLVNQRLPGEDFDTYKARQRINNRYLKRYLKKGRLYKMAKILYPPVGTRVTVTWEDHHEYTGEVFNEEAIKQVLKEKMVGEASGVVAAEGKDRLVIASNYWPKTKEYDGSIFVILKKTILKLEH